MSCKGPIWNFFAFIHYLTVNCSALNCSSTVSSHYNIFSFFICICSRLYFIFISNSWAIYASAAILTLSFFVSISMKMDLMFSLLLLLLLQNGSDTNFDGCFEIWPKWKFAGAKSCRIEISVNWKLAKLKTCPIKNSSQ